MTGGTIYLIQSGTNGPVKIGFTRLDVGRRMAQLQTGNPFKLKLVAQISGGKKIERHLHGAFDHLRLAGEWFSPDSAIFAAFDAAQEWPSDPQTLSPVTPRGIEFLRECLDLEPVRERYPDGSLHEEIDWDELAIISDRAVRECAR